MSAAIVVPLAAVLIPQIPGLVQAVLGVVDAIRAHADTSPEAKTQLDGIAQTLDELKAKVAAVRV